tara:strand:+ start:774 stop:899 length:126 start_codon:yes stop_codon:yes gene_type:complete
MNADNKMTEGDIKIKKRDIVMIILASLVIYGLYKLVRLLLI